MVEIKAIRHDNPMVPKLSYPEKEPPKKPKKYRSIDDPW
jgi:hypothetical protein